VRADTAWARLARGLIRALTLRCPRCGGGALFPHPGWRGWLRMASACPRCGLRYERAQGYWVGAIYINYGATAVLVMGGYLLLWTRHGLSTAWQLAIWIPFCIVFPLVFFRWSRSLWLALEYSLNPEP
jgi:uncharacterized protein (DUF983 family)